MKAFSVARRWLPWLALGLLLAGTGWAVAGFGPAEAQRRLTTVWRSLTGPTAEVDHDHACGKSCAHGGAASKSTAPTGGCKHDEQAAHDDHDDHDDHDRAAVTAGNATPGKPAAADHQHDELAAIALSNAARDNVGIRLEKAALRTFQRTITVPAMLAPRPGRTETFVAAPLTGVVTRVWPMQGETVAAEAPLFDLRLTHEEVVEAQGEFLRTAEEVEVVRREIARLESVASSGAIAGKTLLERRYEQQKLDAGFRSQRQRLLLHGLTAAQVDGIAAKHELLSAVTVYAPKAMEAAAGASTPHIVQVEELKATPGQHVKAGDPLCVLADYSELFIQGKAFEQDLPWLEKAASGELPITAVVNAADKQRQTVNDLHIVYLAPRVEPDSRAFTFYVALPNRLSSDRRTADGRRFSSWQFKPGQRVEILAPVERWENRIVLPEGAVVQDGAEAYVFEQNEGHFDRRTVRVEYRDQRSVVIANDGQLLPGRMVVVSGAYQVHLAMKNKAGGAPDPHAGHNH